MVSNLSAPWYKDIEIVTTQGYIVRVLRRSIESDTSSAQLDTEPFFFLPTLVEHTTANGSRNVSKGLMDSIAISKDNKWSVGINVENAGSSLIEIDAVSECSLTVWRVFDELDALQARISGNREALYIQTGGARLLEIFTTAEQDPQARRILDLFNESITGSIYPQNRIV